ncbi:MAG: protein kinase [Selenomonadaceae bacterium]|nr:protein kinase [Selenomonadaceae bacterium]
MNPLQFLYSTVDVIKDGKNGKISLVYDNVGKQFYIMKERDLKTAEIYSRLKDLKSPYLPEIYHAVESDGKFFIVEEFIQGRTLAEILTHNNGLDEKNSADVLKQVCNALKILHALKIIHRDIKPSNIMVTKTGAVKLIDFSIARIEKANRDTDTDFLGTRGYAPPEQYGFGQTDSRSDIYSLGVTIQEILGENYDGYLNKILSKCTNLNPAERYQSADEILADIDKKYFAYKIKNVALKLAVTCAAVFFIVFAAEKFLAADEVPPVATEPESSAVEEIAPPVQSAPPEKYESEKVEWYEIKIPSANSTPTDNSTPASNSTPAENISPPVQTTPPIQAVTPPVLEPPAPAKKVSDPRLNRVCTLTLNGNTYSEGAVEIPASIWQTWQSDGENVYLPQNFSVGLNLANTDSAPLNISVKADLNGLKKSEKIFPAVNLAGGQSENFQIPIGGLACSNGSFEVEIWLRTGDNAPLVSFWNGKQFSANHSVRIFLRDYVKLTHR